MSELAVYYSKKLHYDLYTGYIYYVWHILRLVNTPILQ